MYDTHETLSDARDASAAADIVRDTSEPAQSSGGHSRGKLILCQQAASCQARGRGKSRPSSLGQDQNSTVEIETALTILRNATVDIASCYTTFLFRITPEYANDDIGNNKQKGENTGEDDETRTLVVALVVNETCGVSHRNPRSRERLK